VCTINNWSAVLEYTQAVTNPGTFLVLIFVVFVGNYVLINLITATILVELDMASHLEETEAAAAEAAVELTERVKLAMGERRAQERRRLASERAADRHRRALLGLDDTGRISVVGRQGRAREASTPGDGAGGRRVVVQDRLQQWAEAGLAAAQQAWDERCYDGFPRDRPPAHWATSARAFVLGDNSAFGMAIQAVIVLNFATLALDGFGISRALKHALARANLCFTVIFSAEMAAKLTVGGIKEYLASRWNAFDGFVVSTSILEV
jgi:hypothetical protein